MVMDNGYHDDEMPQIWEVIGGELTRPPGQRGTNALRKCGAPCDTTFSPF